MTTGHTAGSYSVCTLATLLNQGGDQDAILAQLDQVFHTFPNIDHPGNDMGSDEKWSAIMSEKPSYVHCLMHSQSGVVGYWSCLPIHRTLFDRGLRGENINRAITLADVAELAVPGDYIAYFVDLYVLRSHRNMSSNRKIYESFTAFLRTAARMGYYFSDIFAHTASYDSIGLCESAGFQFVTDHQTHVMTGRDGTIVPTRIYDIHLADCRGKLFEIDPKLHAVYARHFRAAADPAPSAWDGLDIDAAIAQGESSRTEFKPSLRTNLHTGEPDRKRELAIAKTVAGFLNAQGGLLLIGVHDDGSPIGADLAAFDSEDRMGIHLSHLLVGCLGAAQARHVDYRFVTVAGQRILAVNCSASQRPAFLREEGRERFYARLGCTTQELNGSHLADFIAERFQGPRA